MFLISILNTRKGREQEWGEMRKNILNLKVRTVNQDGSAQGDKAEQESDVFRGSWQAKKQNTKQNTNNFCVYQGKRLQEGRWGI